MYSAVLNYPIYDKELIAIIQSLKFWRAKLIKLKHPFIIITNYKAPKYFNTKQFFNLK